MKGDFSRITFDPTKRYSQVLLQQGRVLIDADWNEQGEIYRYALRQALIDLIGPHAAPAGADGEAGQGFRIQAGRGDFSDDFIILPGPYYVAGIRVENSDVLRLSKQPGYPFPGCEIPDKDGFYLAYLDVWERHVTSQEDKSLLEPALGGADTTTRAQIAWQVKCIRLEKIELDYRQNYSAFLRLLKEDGKLAPGDGRLAATTQPARRIRAPEGETGSVGYTGSENQLYRVEIHYGSESGEGAMEFKWSRDNGSLYWRVTKVAIDETRATTMVWLEGLEGGGRRSLQAGAWGELFNDQDRLADRPGALLRVLNVDSREGTVTLDGKAIFQTGERDSTIAWLRRWEGRNPVIESAEEWISLEEGILVRFEPGEEDQPHHYQAGDYWQIPARTTLQDILWPQERDAQGKAHAIAIAPQGTQHNAAPLALVHMEAGRGRVLKDYRRRLTKHWK